MIGAGQFLKLSNPEWLVNKRSVIQRDLVEFVDAAEHFLRGSEVAAGCADENQCAFEKELFEQRFQRVGIILANVAVADYEAKIVSGAGEGDEIGRIIREALEGLAGQLDRGAHAAFAGLA